MIATISFYTPFLLFLFPLLVSAQENDTMIQDIPEQDAINCSAEEHFASCLLGVQGRYLECPPGDKACQCAVFSEIRTRCYEPCRGDLADDDRNMRVLTYLMNIVETMCVEVVPQREVDDPSLVDNVGSVILNTSSNATAPLSTPYLSRVSALEQVTDSAGYITARPTSSPAQSRAAAMTGSSAASLSALVCLCAWSLSIGMMLMVLLA